MDELLRRKWHEARISIQAKRAAMCKASNFMHRESLAVEVEKEELRFRQSLSREEIRQLDQRIEELHDVPEESRQLETNAAVKSADPKDNDEFYLLRRLIRGA